MPDSTAQKFARAVEAAGWEVVRIKKGEMRQVVATRGRERYVMSWHLGAYDNGRYVFEGGKRIITFEDGTRAIRVISSARQAEALMTDPALTASARPAAEPGLPRRDGRTIPARIVDLPFDIETDDDRTVCAALAGRRIEWVNSLTGAKESGILPRGGMHLTVSASPAGPSATRRRYVSFTDQKFRSVWLDQIVSVK